ncbi:MAG: alpha/beta fold hydrolase [Solirubrobacterales bacterium]
MSRAGREVVERWEARGRYFSADGVKSFVVDEGDGDPVLLMHGVPASAFLYRKVISELPARGLRGVAFDLPGLGLAERPPDYDYSWSGLGRFSLAAIDALGLERFHLVVHDIGGPVGFEIAAAVPERVLSLTVLNTLIKVDGFRKPPVMRPFGVRGAGELWVGSMNELTIVPLMWMQGIQNRAATPTAELRAYARLLKRGDRGKAFLKIMRGFEPTAEKERLYTGALQAAEYPKQIVWGARDTALRAAKQGREAREILADARYIEVPGKHFLQEDQAPALAEAIAELAAT